MLRMTRKQRPSPLGVSARTSRLAAAALTLAFGLGGSLALGTGDLAHAAPRQGGSVLVDETFTQASAPEFTGVGSACLTGAPQVAALPGPGDHPLGGCTEGVGPVPPNNAAPHGYLRLTDSSNDQSGAVLYNHALPANRGLDVTFDQWQYGTTTGNIAPADGISFFLVDGETQLTHPGAFGGSLGYAQKLPDDDPNAEFQPGVDGGYLGVGLDVLGNYFGDWEHRGNGCPPDQRSPAGTSFHVPAPGANMVTLRGPGDGIEGYCFLTATTSNFSTTGPWPSTLPGQLQGPTTTVSDDPVQAERDLEPSRRRVHVVITPAPDPQVTVSIDFNDGNGFQQVLQTAAPTPVPPTYKFGFAASTGLFTDTHLIRNVVVRTDRPLPELNLVKQVRQPLPGDLTAGSRVPYDFVVTNSGGTTIEDLAVDDPKVGPVSCPVTTLAPGQTVTCTATYTVTAADVAHGSIDNTATATGTSDGETVTSPPSSESVPIERVPGIEVEKQVETPGPYSVGQAVTYRYTVRNTGGVELTDVAVHDDHVRDITCESGTLAPAEETGDSTTCTGTYTITAADGTAGSVTNTATATGSANGERVTSPETYQTIPVGRPHLTLHKRVVSSGPYQVGSTVRYAYTVTNTGSTPLHDVHVADDRVATVTCDDTTLAPGGTTTCHGSYQITQADADVCLGNGTRGDGGDGTVECRITNIAQAGATDPQGREIVSEPASATVTVRVEPEPPCPGYGKPEDKGGCDERGRRGRV
ncbi:putative repeat protein (TIGR01451 family) [Streptomyces sp. PsTaAH-130]|nr:putative repeat protein (TIGR01451 family) [Streptomyces sp. PsTaAH-130]